MMRFVNTEKKTANGRFGRGLTVLLCAAMLFTGWLAFGVQDAYAVTCYIDAQPEQAEVGQDVTVTVVFSGDNVGRVRATLEYDRSVLSYQGEEGDSGEVSLYMASSGDGISYSLPFKAVGAGSCALTMTPLDAYDMDEMSISLPESQGMTVTVKAAETPAAQPAETPEAPEQVTEDPQTADNTDREENAGTLVEKQDQPERSNMAVYILAGLAALIAVALIIVLVRRARRREDY